MSDPANVSGEVSLAARLAWLGAALWVIAVKAVVVVTWTPVEITVPRARLWMYAVALGLPCLPPVLVAVRSALAGHWRRGLIASAVLGLLLTGITASGAGSAAVDAAKRWETVEILYRHRTESNRTIERQRRADGPGWEGRTVQTRPITSFLSYTEFVGDDDPGPAWVPVPR
ncbi:MAG: hypothetical protein GVY25_03365 [Bacteroidetes bacterium]|jgi:hypothetical protein|nr:hypothetical protein [Bacteroidota bacterium]